MSGKKAVQPHDAKRRFDVTLAGDTALDVLMYGLPDALPVECELLADGMAIRLGGSAAITAHNLAALGNAVGFISAASDDDFGRMCQSELREAGVDLSRCVPARRAQSGVTVHLQHEKLRHMFTYAGATADLSYDDLDVGYLSDTRHFHMSSYYLQRALTPRIPELFAELKKAGATISLDPNDDPTHQWARGILDAIRHVDVLMPNEREACLLAGEPDLDRAISLLRGLVPVLVIKRGANGATGFCREKSWHADTQMTKVVDAVGAGDSFNAGFLHAWLRGWPIERALALGNLTGALSVSASGGTAAFRDKKNLQERLARVAAELEVA